MTLTEPPRWNQTAIFGPLGVWENHPGGICQLWAAEKIPQKTLAQTLLHQVPTLTLSSKPRGRCFILGSGLSTPCLLCAVSCHSLGGVLALFWLLGSCHLGPHTLVTLGMVSLAVGPVSTPFLACPCRCPSNSKDRPHRNQCQISKSANHKCQIVDGVVFYLGSYLGGWEGFSP